MPRPIHRDRAPAPIVISTNGALAFNSYSRHAMTSSDPGSQRCALCQVEIQGNGSATDRVLFSRGTPGTRSKLWARVCQYLKNDEQKQQCINQDPALRGEPMPGDGFEEINAIQLGESGASS